MMFHFILNYCRFDRSWVDLPWLSQVGVTGVLLVWVEAEVGFVVLS